MEHSEKLLAGSIKNFPNYKLEVSVWFSKMHWSWLLSALKADGAGTSNTTTVEWKRGEDTAVPTTPTPPGPGLQVNHFDFPYLPLNFHHNFSTNFVESTSFKVQYLKRKKNNIKHIYLEKHPINKGKCKNVVLLFLNRICYRKFLSNALEVNSTKEKLSLEECIHQDKVGFPLSLLPCLVHELQAVQPLMWKP